MRLPSSPLFVAAGVSLAGALLGGGCATDYRVKIDALARANAFTPGRYAYRIEDRAGTDPQRTLRQKEIAGLLKTALSSHGLYEAADARTADIIVELSYGLGTERVQETSRQELIQGRPITELERQGPRPEGVAREISGYTVLATTTVVREKFLSICARRVSGNAEQPGDDLWRVHVSIEDESDDLRGHLPVLIATAMDQIGRTTEQQVTAVVRSDVESIRFLRRGL